MSSPFRQLLALYRPVYSTVVPTACRHSRVTHVQAGRLRPEISKNVGAVRYRSSRQKCCTWERAAGEVEAESERERREAQ